MQEMETRMRDIAKTTAQSLSEAPMNFLSGSQLLHPQCEDVDAAQVWMGAGQRNHGRHLNKKNHIKLAYLQESFTLLGDTSENGSPDGLRTNRDHFWD